MKSIESADGVLIAYEKTGEGPPLVLVHGTPDDHSYWEMVQPTLAKYYTVFALDRRGRGQSGDTADYKLELEFDDVVAVVDMIDDPVILLGHSHGGIVAQEAALRTKNLHKLILYEPPIMDGSGEPDDSLLSAIATMETTIKEGKNEQALLFFKENLLGMPPDAIENERSTKYWQVMVNAAPTLPRELKAVAGYKFNAAKFNDLNLPTLLLSGSESPELFKEAIKKLNEALPNSRITVLEGQEHDAALTAPDLFTDKVLQFARKQAD
jgi:pimeloyl-ACP methyl ester carboxylesterase